MSKKYVYFMKPVGMPGPVKIGCSGFLKERLTQISVWSPFPLEIVYFEEGDHSLERNLHRCFADYHSHLEWFHPGERLLRAIEKLRAGGKIAEVIDLRDKRGSIFEGRFKGVPEILEGYRSYVMRIIWSKKRARAAGHDRAYAPADIDEIMEAWIGNSYDGVVEKVRPNQKQFQRLDEFLANPEKHLQTREERWSEEESSAIEHGTTSEEVAA